MLKPIMLAGILVFSSPVLAQSASSDGPSEETVRQRTDTDHSSHASAAQVAQIVEREFPAYDGDNDGEMTQAEFGKWMVALRKASDPETDEASAEVQTWVGQAFASADADKSTKVSQVELTAFLSQGTT